MVIWSLYGVRAVLNQLLDDLRVNVSKLSRCFSEFEPSPGYDNYLSAARRRDPVNLTAEDVSLGFLNYQKHSSL